MAKVKIDEARAIELYEKYGSMNRAALSVGCASSTLKKILVKNGIKIKPYKPVRWDINSARY